jgi:hypothetical protein
MNLNKKKQKIDIIINFTKKRKKFMPYNKKKNIKKIREIKKKEINENKIENNKYK